jgi:hypothetical protein
MPPDQRPPEVVHPETNADSEMRPERAAVSAHCGEPHEILAVAVFEPLPGLETEALATVRELSATLERGGYSRDVLYREPDGAYVLVRYWKSDEARRHAPEDPDAQRCWARLAHEIRTIKIYERLEEIPL